jgi:methylase of polypeptide subunit release factors
VAYITGHREFYGREFHVTRDTLIPRPETEHLIETALNAIFNFQFSIFKNIDIIDVGTGSGNIIITLAKEIEKRSHQAEIKYFALDISKSALAIAKDNAMRHDIATKITFLESNLLKHLPVSLLQDHHLIITANLPYLSHNIYHESDPDVRDYEPASALVSGEDGLDHYVRLLTEIHTFLPHVRSLTFFLRNQSRTNHPAHHTYSYGIPPGHTPRIPGPQWSRPAHPSHNLKFLTTKNPDKTGIFCFGFTQRPKAKLFALLGGLLLGYLLGGLLLCHLLLCNLLCCLFLCCHNTHLLLNLCSFLFDVSLHQSVEHEDFYFLFFTSQVLCVIQIFSVCIYYTLFFENAK